MSDSFVCWGRWWFGRCGRSGLMRWCFGWLVRVVMVVGVVGRVGVGGVIGLVAGGVVWCNGRCGCGAFVGVGGS